LQNINKFSRLASKKIVRFRVPKRNATTDSTKDYTRTTTTTNYNEPSLMGRLRANWKLVAASVALAGGVAWYYNKNHANPITELKEETKDQLDKLRKK